MTLTGQSTINIQEKNKSSRLKRVLLSALIICFFFILCYAILVVLLMTGSRGDWDYNIIDNYFLVRVNSEEIVLSRYLEEGHRPIIINNCYVEAFSNNESYIAVQGVPMQNHAVVQEALDSDDRIYYLVDTKSGEIIFICEDLNSFALFCFNECAFDNLNWIHSLDCAQAPSTPELTVLCDITQQGANGDGSF